MKSHNIQTSDPEACETSFWELIPWYVNGSMPAEEAEAFAQHLETCPDCHAEINRQHMLAKEVATTDPFEVPLAQSWETLRSQITAESKARTPQRQSLWRFFEARKGLAALIGSASLACLVLIVQVQNPSDDGFQTLTTTPDSDAPRIKFQVAPGTTDTALEQILAREGVTLASGPTKQGIYTAIVTTDKNAEAIADALMATPTIVFAATEAPS
ncbi:MAG: zf-HC2 domain-containing protein [Sulfitobacter sp.]